MLNLKKVYAPIKLDGDPEIRYAGKNRFYSISESSNCFELIAEFGTILAERYAFSSLSAAIAFIENLERGEEIAE